MNSLANKTRATDQAHFLSGRSNVVQPKLEINQPGDQYEHEADAMAERVMRMSSKAGSAKPVTGLIGSSVQRKCSECEEEEKKKKVMRKEVPGSGGMQASSALVSSLNASKGGGTRLPEGTKSFMENAFSADFSAVRVHTDSRASEMNDSIQAKAFTNGNDIYFKEGQFALENNEGKTLLGHELTHVVQQTSKNSSMNASFVIQRQGISTTAAPSATDDITLEDILAARNFRAARFFDFLRTHPGQVSDARVLLITRIAGSPQERTQALPLLTQLLREHRNEIGEAETQIREISGDARTDAENSVNEMWGQYRSAAYLYALHQWTLNHLTAERGHRPRVQPGQPPPLPSHLEVELSAQLAACNLSLAEARRQRTALYNRASTALGRLMSVSAPLTYINEEMLRNLSDLMMGDTNARRRERIHITEARQLLNYHPSTATERQLGDVEEQRDRAALALTTAREQLSNIEAEPESGSAREREVHRTRLVRARRELAAAERAEERTARNATPEGAESQRNRELALFMRSRDAGMRQEAEEVLQQSESDRDAAINPLLAEAPESEEVSGETWTAGDFLTEGDRWDIYTQALQYIETGFSSFTAEANQQLIVSRLSGIASDRQNIGLGSTVSVGTYTGHGEGQYDISQSAGHHVNANRPDTLNLSVALGLRPDGSSRQFLWQSSQIRHITPVDEHSADNDTLSKLLYGYFGRAWNSRRQIDDYLAGARNRLPARDPDPSRIIAALYFNNTIEQPAGNVQVFNARRIALRAGFENDIRADLLASAGIAVSGPLLEPVNASSGQFDATYALVQNTIISTRDPHTGQNFTRASGRAAVIAAAERVLRRANTSTGDMETLIRDMLAAGLNGGRSGPSVQLVHLYQEVDDANQLLPAQVWITVDYIHLSSVTSGMASGGQIAAGADLGAVGSAGNAVSPHVHMGIAVYDRNPGTQTTRVPIAFLTPFQFFPFQRRNSNAATNTNNGAAGTQTAP